MAKQVFNNTTLRCILQENSVIKAHKRLNGNLVKTREGFRFEEEAPDTKPRTRNPKIFNGSFISLVRKEDDSIQFAFKTTKADLDPEKYPSEVYEEINKALQMIQ